MYNFRIYTILCHRNPRIKYSCKMRINIAREQALSHRYCYSRDINRDAICIARLQWDSAKYSFPMDNVVSKGERNAPETRLVTITSHTFPLRVREIIFAVCSFVHSFVHLFVRLVNRSNGKHSIDRELQHDVHLFTAKY